MGLFLSKQIKSLKHSSRVMVTAKNNIGNQTLDQLITFLTDGKSEEAGRLWREF